MRILIWLMLLASLVSAHAATLLPPGKQQFVNGNGQPIAAGKIYMYVPNTTQLKQTWQDSKQSVSNTNPILIDGNGYAVIYGTGTYRQIVTDMNGVQLWDQITASTDVGQPLWGGTSAGGGNVYSFLNLSFSGVDGTQLSFVAGSTNTGPSQISIPGYSFVNILRDTPSGPQSLVGGEIVTGNVVSLVYSQATGAFHLVSPPVNGKFSSDVSIGSGNNFLKGGASITPWVNVRTDCGAKGDGTTDDTAAWQQCVAAYNKVGAAQQGCGVFYIPPGAYEVDFSKVDAIACPTGGIIKGDGEYRSSVIQNTSSAGDTLVLKGSVEMKIQDIQFSPTKFRPNSFEINITSCFRCIIDHIRMDYAYSGIKINTSTATVITNPEFRYMTGTFGIYYVGDPTIGRGNHLTVENYLADNPTPAGTDGHSFVAWTTGNLFTTGQLTVLNGYTWQVVQGGTSGGIGPHDPNTSSSTSMFDPKNDYVDGSVTWRVVWNQNLTWFVQENFADSVTLSSTQLLDGYHCIQMNNSSGAAGGRPGWLYGWDVECDHQFGDSVALIGGFGFHIVNSWISSSLTGAGIHVGGNYTGEIDIGQTRVFGNSKQGIAVDSNAGSTYQIQDIRVHQSMIGANSATTFTTYPGIEIGAGIGKFSIVDNEIGTVAGIGLGQQSYGIVVDTGVGNNFIINTNDLTGNVTGGFSNGATGTNKIVPACGSGNLC